MPITIVALLVLSFTPAKWLGWTNWFTAQVNVAIVPITHPFTIVKRLRSNWYNDGKR